MADVWADMSRCSVTVANTLCSWLWGRSHGAPRFVLGKRPSQPGCWLGLTAGSDGTLSLARVSSLNPTSGWGTVDIWCLRTYGFDFWLFCSGLVPVFFHPPGDLYGLRVPTGIIFPPGLIVLIVFNLSESDSGVLLWLILAHWCESGWGLPSWCHHPRAFLTHSPSRRFSLAASCFKICVSGEAAIKPTLRVTL